MRIVSVREKAVRRNAIKIKFPVAVRRTVPSANLVNVKDALRAAINAKSVRVEPVKNVKQQDARIAKEKATVLAVRANRIRKNLSPLKLAGSSR